MGAETSRNRWSGLAGTTAVVLARVVVPLWLALGAVLKLVDMSPSHLPAAVVKWCGGMGFDLVFVLRFSIAFELVVAGVMVLLPPLARWVGLVTLAAFMPVLIGDLALGASSCGCFGAVKVSPWVTLVTDVAFFLGLLFLGRREKRLAFTPTLDTRRVLIAGCWTLLVFAVAFAVPTGRNGAEGETPGAEVAARGNLPKDGFYLPVYQDWIGQKFVDLDIAGWISDLPGDLDLGPQYVVFYRKDCEHCHELMELHFSAELPAPTLAVAVPERTGFPTENVQVFECGGCRTAELPSGVDWFLQTPVLVRLDGGVVECAAEVEALVPECLEY